MPDGTRCTEMRCLQIGHIAQPYARGGPNTVDNTGLVCPMHDGWQAGRDFGPLFMAEKRPPPKAMYESLATCARLAIASGSTRRAGRVRDGDAAGRATCFPAPPARATAPRSN